MRRMTLGQSDVEVSVLAWGAMQAGGSWDDEPITDDAVHATRCMIDTALTAGINHIDLADIYCRGKSDLAIGAVLKERPALRDQLVLEQKCGIVVAGADARVEPKRYDFSFRHIVGAVEDALRRVHTDYFDILALHRPDPLMEPDEVALAFNHLHQSGKVRWFGVSNHSRDQVDLLQRWVDQPLIVNQVEVSLSHHHLITDGMLSNHLDHPDAKVAGLLDYCRCQRITVQAWSPLAGGRLLESAARSTLERIATDHATTPEAIALAWLLRHPAGIQPLVGTMNPARLTACADAARIKLSRAEWFALLEAVRGTRVP